MSAEMSIRLENLVKKMIQTKKESPNITDAQCIRDYFFETLEVKKYDGLKALVFALNNNGYLMTYTSIQYALKREEKNRTIAIQQPQNNIFSQEKITSPNNTKQVIINQDKKEDKQSQTKTELPVTDVPIPLTHKVKSYAAISAETEREMAEIAKMPTAHERKLMARMEAKEAKQRGETQP